MISAGQMRSLNSTFAFAIVKVARDFVRLMPRLHEHVNLTMLQLESTLLTHASATVADTVIRDSAVEQHSPTASRSRCL